MRLRTLLIISCCLVMLSCDTLTQMTSFINCKYEFAGLSNPTVAGIDFSNVQSIDDLKPAALLKLTTGYMSGSLPLTTTVKVRATNPNTAAAQLEGLEWAIDLDNKNLLSGAVDQRIAVAANGGQTIIPVAIQVNIMDLIAGESKDNVLNLVNSFLHVGESSSKVSIRVKPIVMVGGQKISAGFVTLSKTIN